MQELGLKMIDHLAIDLDIDDLSRKDEGPSKPDNRNSEDKKVNARGKDLLDLCKLNNIII